MATSGKINGSPAQSYPGLYAYWADWKINSSSIDKNTSNITVWLRLQRIDGANAGAYNLADKPSVSLSVGGSAKTPSIAYIDTRNKVVCTFATWTGDVKHNADGTLNCPISASFTHYGSSTLTGGSLNGTAVLDTIPQGATIDDVSCTTDYFTGELTVRYTPKSAALYNRCRLELDENGTTTHLVDFDVGQMSAAQQTMTINLGDDELSTIYNHLTAAPPSGAMKITMLTYSDEGYSQQVGFASSKSLMLSVPQNDATNPTASISVLPVSSLPSAFAGLYIQGKTKVEATLSASAKYGASIAAQSVTVGGKACSVSGNVYTSEFLQNYGTVEVVGSVADTRGFTNSASKQIEVIAYGNPKVLKVSAERSDGNGNADPSGTSLLISAERSYSPVVSGNVQKNFCEIQYMVKRSGGKDGEWKTLLAKTTAGDTVKAEVEKGAISVESTYVVQVRAVDDMGFVSPESTISVPTDKVYMHRSQNALGLGKYAEVEGLDIDWPVQMNGNRITGLPDPTEDTDAVPWGKVNGSFAPSSHVADMNNPHEVTADQVGAAPSGYGLGGIGTAVTNWNDAKANGWYSAKGDAANAPFPGFGSWGYVVAFAETDAIIQAAYTYTSDDWAQDGIFEKKRVYKSSTGWLEWEWVNPCMTTGTEYRTTDRFYGKPVYKRVLHVGYLSAGVNSFNHGIANIDECVGIDMINEGFGLFTAHCDAEFSQTGIYLNMPWAAGAVKLILAYTKN